ncbi:MAG: 23S rRNA (pseudouridine(1915)-N(3))-methyltransferase RlmH, partial [Patescibacteria group bacterium]|nr:23S rRNA (pseudouridine(1915)-N(3))-methyltransferase RlmH [Patescibacteria group bacterium]
MEIKVINLGGISQSFVKEGIFYYLEKIKPLAEISLIMPSKKINYSSKNDKLKKQAEFGLKYLDNAYNIFLDINGKQFDS